MKCKYLRINRIDCQFVHEHGEARGTNLPGTEEIMHIHSAYVSYDARGQGLGDKYHKDRLEHLSDEGCVKYLTCVVSSNNHAQIKIVEKNGWELLKEIKGYMNTVYLYGKQL